MDWMKPPSLPRTRCASSRRCAVASRWIRRPLFTSCSRWRTKFGEVILVKWLRRQWAELELATDCWQLIAKNLEKRVMRTSKWFLTAAMLASLGAAAQQAADPQASAQPPAPEATQAAQ